MKCINCGGRMIILDSRHSDNGLKVRRRYECTTCKTRMSTLEQVEMTTVSIPKISKEEA